jgi:hypothetical protein
MTEIVEVFWNAQPHLSRLRIKVGGGALDPVADRLFSDIRSSVAATFPGSVTLVRIGTKKGDAASELRVVRNGEPECPKVHASVSALIDRSVEAAEKERAEALSIAQAS